LMALMMIGPQSTQTTRSLFPRGLATSAEASVSIWLAPALVGTLTYLRYRQAMGKT
jgi:hypothetical protein